MLKLSLRVLVGYILPFGIIALSPGWYVYQKEGGFVEESVPRNKTNVVDKAFEAGAQVSVELFRRAGLEKVLKNDGPFTLIIPGNKAWYYTEEFNKQRMLNDKEFLKHLLLFHVLKGRLKIEDFEEEQTYPTLLPGRTIRFTTSQSVTTRDRKFRAFSGGLSGLTPDVDVLADNGVVHVIDEVLWPDGTTQTAFEYLWDNPSYSVLATGIRQVGLKGLFSNKDPITVFAPTDKGFQKFSRKYPGLLEDKSLLRDIILYHVVPGSTMHIYGMQTNMDFPTELGDSVNIRKTANVSIVLTSADISGSQAKIMLGDFPVRNGVIHSISDVLLPPGML